MRELLARVRQQMRTFLTRRTRTQKVALSVLGTALILALVTAWTLSDRREYQILLEGRPRELHSLLDLLDQQRIPTKLIYLPGGNLRLEVSGGDDYRRAVKIAGQNGYGTGTGTTSEPLLSKSESNIFVMTTDKLRVQENEAKIRRVEEAILFNPRIASVRVVFTRRKGDIFSSRPGEKVTAAVGLRLKPHVPGLSVPEVASIRGLVGGSFNIPLENIQVAVGGSTAAALPDEIDSKRERLQEEIRRRARNLYLGQYRESQFNVEVAVDLSLRDAQTEETAVDPEGSKPRPVEQGPKRQKTVPELALSTRKTKTNIPAGEIEQVAITLKLDLLAVQRVLREEDELIGRKPRKGADGEVHYDPREFDERLKAYEKDQQDLLANLSPVPESTRVTVSITPFPAPGSSRSAGDGLEEASTLAGWGTVVGVATGSCGFLGLWWLVLRRGRLRKVLSTAGPTQDGGRRQSKAMSQGFSACQETLQLARDAARVVRERPEVAASVLRLWLASASGGNGTGGPESEAEDRKVTVSSS